MAQCTHVQSNVLMIHAMNILWHSWTWCPSVAPWNRQTKGVGPRLSRLHKFISGVKVLVV